jgi:hypothetical protein
VKRLTDPSGSAIANDFDAKLASGQPVNCWEIPETANPLKWETFNLWSAGGKKLSFANFQAKPFLPAGTQRFVFEMHYSASTGGTGSDQPMMRFKFAPAAPQGTYVPVVLGGTVGAFALTGNPPTFSIPGNTANFTVPTAGYATTLPFTSYRMILGILPHMHKYGRSFVTKIYRANGNIECLIEVPNYNFNWQWTYMFEQPVILGPGDTIDSTFVFDTTGHPGPVYLGEQSEDEMAFGFTYEALVPGG